jgi:tetratricopeptide (TPR) repeat protein
VDLNFWKKDDSHEKSEEQVEYQYAPQEASMESTATDVVNSPEYYKPEPADPEKARFYNKISRWAVYAAVVMMPLFFLPWTSSPLELNKQMLLVVLSGVGIVSWLLGVVSSGYLAWRINSLDKGVLALMGAFVVGSIFSISRFNSIFGASLSLSNSLVSIVALTILYFLIVNNSENRGKDLRSLVGLSIVVALIFGLLQIFGVYLIKLPFAASRAFNSVGAINVLGIIAAVSLPFFSKSRFDMKWLKNAHIEKVGVVLSLLLLILLNWWVLWTVAIAGMVGMIIFENIGGGRFSMRKLLLPMTVVILGVFLMVVNLNLNALKNQLPVEVSPSFNLSKDIGVSVIKENFMFGYGHENYSVAFDKYGAGRLSLSTLSDAKFFDSTSEVITLITQGGLVMALALGFLLWCLVMVIWRFHKYAAENHGQESVKEDSGVLATMVALIAAMFFYSFNMTLMTMLYVFMGLVVLVIFDKNRREFNIEEKTSLSLSSSLGFIGGLILVLVGVYFGATIYISDVKFAQAVAEKDHQIQASLLVDAINWNSQDNRYYRSASQVALNLLAAELAKPATSDSASRVQNYITTSISLAKKATEISPRDSEAWNNLGVVYQNLVALVDGVDRLSEEAYMKASELRPGDPAFNYRIGMLYLGKLDLLAQLVSARRINSSQANIIATDAIGKAEENLKKAVDLSPNLGLAIYNLGVVYERQGKVNEAITQLEKIVAANSNQPGLIFELGLLYYRGDRKNDAFNALQRAVVLAPDYSNARWYLALILEERKDLDGAIAQLERILSVDVNKDNPTVMTKLEELRAGKTKNPPGDILDETPIQ